MNAKNFRAAFCERFQLPAETFEAGVLWRCHHRRGLPLGKLIWRFNPQLYDPDLELLQQVAECTTLNDLRAEVSDFRYRHRNHGFCRRVLHARLSGQRLVDLAAKLLD